MREGGALKLASAQKVGFFSATCLHTKYVELTMKILIECLTSLLLKYQNLNL